MDGSFLTRAFGTGNSSVSLTLTSLDILVWFITMINANVPDPYGDIKLCAIDCGLWYCVNSYSSAIVNGTLM